MSTGELPGGIPEVGVEALPERPVILDVREDDEWDAGHVEGAVHIPLAELPGRLDEIPQDLPEGQDLVVVCRGGGRSARATGWLIGQGVEAVNLDGGMVAWARARRPMVTDTGAEPTVL